MKENQFFAMMSRMKYINRWGLMRNTYNENICEHSLQVAMIAHALGVIDSTEIITGDMPTPVKYYSPIIRNAYNDVEKEAKDQLLAGIPEEMQPVYAPLLLDTEEERELWKYVKAADKISAYIKCIEEGRMGNRDFEKAGESIKDIINDMGMDEVDFFMEKFIPAYMITLDETR